jgi:hypothetical protein
MQTLSGTMWKLIEAPGVDEEGHELAPPLGQVPMGFAMFEAERMIVAVADGRLSLPLAGYSVASVCRLQRQIHLRWNCACHKR